MMRLFRKRVRYKDISCFARQLAMMQKAGLPLLKNLELLGGSPGPMQSILYSLKKDIERGKPFAESLRKFPKQFDRLFCNVIEVGEAAGILDEVLLKLAEHREKVQTLKNALIKAFSYPLIVLLVAMSIGLGLLLFIVPQFQGLFAEFNTPLPPLTRIVVLLSKALKTQGLWISSMLVFAIAAAGMLKRHSERFNEYWDRVLLNLPVFGKLIQKALLIRITRTLSLMLNSGMPLSQALQILSRHFENRCFKFAMTKAWHLLKNGQSFYKALSSSPCFPRLLIQMLRVGEETGSLEAMLNKAAELYQEELDHAVGVLKELLEPALMTLLGLIVGCLVIAMYLPVFNLGNVL